MIQKKLYQLSKFHPVGLDVCMKFAGKACVAVACLMAGLASAQQYSISTVAGGAPPATPISATGISVGQPQRVVKSAVA